MSQNITDKPLTFTPELRKITRLDNMEESPMFKSPSWPSSPAMPRTEVKREGNEPAYWTLGRRGMGHKVSDGDFHYDSADDKNRTRDDSIKEIQTILSSMDIGRFYMRLPNKDSMNSSSDSDAHPPLRRSMSENPQLKPNCNNSIKKSFLDSLPPAPKTKSILESSDEPPRQRERIYSLDLCPVKHSPRKHSKVNSKLKELTERLRPSSAPPSPHGSPKYHVPRSAPPTSSFSFFKDPLPLDLNGEQDKNNAKEPPEDEENNKISNGKKPGVPRKTNAGYATLPRMKTLELGTEPRTLASLDLNINFESLRNHQSSSPERDNLHSSSAKQRDKKEHCPTESSFVHNENIYGNKSRRGSDDDVSSTHSNSSRRGSLKNTSSPRKAEFDLNFSKFGSLTSSNRVERKKSVGKRDSFSSSENLHKSDAPRHSRKSSLNFEFSKSDSESDVKQHTDGISGKDPKPLDERRSRKSNLNFDYSKISDTESDVRRSDGVSGKDSKPLDERHYLKQGNGTKSVPVLPSSYANPLEEEIRTIAKLLDGKESLFFKLIESSKRDNATAQKNLDESLCQQRSFEEVVHDSPEPTRRPSTFRSSTDRNSPSRLRAMTVPGTEPNRNSAPSQSSPPPQQKRFYKKKLRGPFGEMLQQEMSKSVNKQRPSYAKDLDFLKEFETTPVVQQQPPCRPRTLLRSSSHSLDETHSVVVDSSPKRKTSANIPLGGSNEEQDSLRVPPTPVSGTVSEPTLHIRSHSDSVKTSSTWNVDNLIPQTAKEIRQSRLYTSSYDSPTPVFPSHLFGDDDEKNFVAREMPFFLPPSVFLFEERNASIWNGF